MFQDFIVRTTYRIEQSPFTKLFHSLVYDVKKQPEASSSMQSVWKDYLKYKTDEDYLTLYINIPFCVQKCKYCEYSSKVKPYGIEDDYINKLEAQFAEATSILGNEPIKSVMFGGGSPSLLTAKQLEKIFSLIHMYWDVEISDKNEIGFEFHPIQLTDQHIDVLRKNGVNRLSMGVQTFNRDILQKENRLAVSKERVEYIYNKVKDFAKIVNVDLLVGLYNQTPDDILNDVQDLLKIGVDIITIYELNPTRGRNNKERKRNNVINMLERVYTYYGKYPGYEYIGTTDKDNFWHCNKFYKNEIHDFDYEYNPSPQGYNNIIGFNLDYKDIQKHTWSFFTPNKKVYQYIDENHIAFYDMDKILNRPEWKEAIKQRI
jgi:coproporphyrinogen III oxidase-like Fe-S oxidoreductase